MRAINSEAMCYSLLLHENLLGSFRFIELLETICIIVLYVYFGSTVHMKVTKYRYYIN